MAAAVQEERRRQHRDSVIGGTNFTGTTPGNNIIDAAQNPLGVGNGFNLGYINGTITVGRNTIFQLGALVTALRGRRQVQHAVDARRC